MLAQNRLVHKIWGGRWCIWFRHYATSRNVAGSIPDGVIKPSCRIMVLGSTQPITEMGTRDISWG